MHATGLDHITYRHAISGYKVPDTLYTKVATIRLKLMNCLAWSLTNFSWFML